ncbi:MAG: hypothetical protein AB1Z22_06560 [Synechococcaceae cyanobacterium]
MADNLQVEQCMHRHRGALLFMAPGWRPAQQGVPVQIVEVFALRLARGYIRDPQGRLLLESHASLAQGRSWSLARACKLLRNDARPERWVVLQRDRQAWGLFWAGGGLQRCRDALLKSAPEDRPDPRPVPATADALLRLVLELDPARGPGVRDAASEENRSWRVAAWTSLAWMLVLGFIVSGFLGVLERQDHKLQLLLERTAPAAGTAGAGTALSADPDRH